ncbi:MFS transporter [Pseudonocardia oroxyli]|uniref:Drug resistance transporter, EmrB/QacA subfamily n=1 Tax=Pseudonocardia oroxyli TaxID=366584 RepID=A0A1G8AQ53_PSEOR|nr:MFS transporter [Pseudonocardia oroxyli]SDH23057.1 drug resistance transporter, EmrB/QacA subfamily [Pseudonocardia oroxyli]
MSEAVRDAPATEDLTPHPRRHAVFVVVGVALLMFSLDQTSVATALTTLGADLDADLAWTGWTLTACAVGQVLALPLGGRLGDQFGKRKVFLVAVAAFVLLSALSATSTSIAQLIVCRFAQGVAGGVILPATSGLVAFHYGRERDRALALFTSVFPMGSIAGPVLGGLILTTWSWHGIFLVNVPIGILLVVAGALLIGEPPRRRPEKVDAGGIALLLGTLVSGMVAITLVGSTTGGGLAPVLVAVCGVLAVVSGWAFLRHARVHPDPVIPLRLLRGGGLGIMNSTNVLFGAALVGFGALLPVYAQTRYALLPLAAGVLLTARAVGTIASSGIAVALLRRLGHRPLVLTGFGLIISGLLVVAVPPAGTSPAVWLTVGAVLCGLGMGLAGPAANNAGMHLVSDEVTAVSGLRIMFRQMGGIASVSVITAVLSASAEPGRAGGVAFAVLAGLLAAAAVGMSRIPNHRGRW